jgi:hypothetical protein
MSTVYTVDELSTMHRCPGRSDFSTEEAYQLTAGTYFALMRERVLTKSETTARREALADIYAGNGHVIAFDYCGTPIKRGDTVRAWRHGKGFGCVVRLVDSHRLSDDVNSPFRVELVRCDDGVEVERWSDQVQSEETST